MDNSNKILFEETKKRLQQILEYTVMPSGVFDEADDDQQNRAPKGGENGDPMMGADGGAMPPMDGGQQSPMGRDPNAQDGQMPPMDGAYPNTQAPQGPEGFAPQGGENGDPMMGGDISNADFEGGDMPSADDDVVDITEFTDSQKETEKDIEQMDAKFTEVMKQLGSFQEILRQNNDKVEQLKSEFEKRNPTQIEKLSMHSAKGYPFDTPVEDYWKEKEKTSNYSPEDDKNGIGQGQYVITKDDLEGNVDWKSISDSMDDDDFMYNQTLNGVLKY